jgi:hypothetical protein
MLCPTCRNALQQSTTLIEGAVTLLCRNCRAITIDGSGVWLPCVGNYRDALHVLAGKVKEEKSIDHDALHSPIEDPRWTRIS